MRQITLDTETTGIGPEHGHRVIEIGCLELENRRLTGRHFHVYLNPQRKIDQGAFAVHGLSHDFLQDKPLFKDVVSEFLAFIDGAELIIHNAPFDVGFLNAELKRAEVSHRLQDKCSVLDTLSMARKKHPGQRNSLDALCRRYDVNNSNRKLHGALIDAELLAFVYLAMTGGQISLLQEEQTVPGEIAQTVQNPLKSQSPIQQATPEELRAHEAFVKFLIEKSGVDHWGVEKQEE